jgi:hypothetical protein
MTAEAIPVATVDDAPVDSAVVETATVEDTASSDQQAIALAVRAAQYSRLEELREVRNFLRARILYVGGRCSFLVSGSWKALPTSLPLFLTHVSPAVCVWFHSSCWTRGAYHLIRKTPKIAPCSSGRASTIAASSCRNSWCVEHFV